MSKDKKTDPMAENKQSSKSGDPFARTESPETEGRASASANEAADGAAAAASSAQEDAREVVEEAQSLEERVQDLEGRLKRAVAEQENLRKRMEREKADVAKYAMANFAREVLGIADNIQRAIDAVPKDAAEHDAALKTFLEGIEVTERELHKAMERHGIARLSPEGEKFDPNYHQAMFEIPTSDVPSGIVVQVVQPGYILADRVLRPAMVGVSKAAPASQGTDDPSDPENMHSGAAGASDDGKRHAEGEPKHEAASSEHESEADAPADSKGDSQQRGASRLNEPVINAETEKHYET